MDHRPEYCGGWRVHCGNNAVIEGMEGLGSKWPRVSKKLIDAVVDIVIDGHSYHRANA